MHRLFTVLVLAFAFTASAFAQTATMTASADGTTPFTFQWKKDGVAIAGATSAVLTLSNLKLSDAGTYTVTISNVAVGPGGGTVSVDQVFTLVILPPSNSKIVTTLT